MFHRVVVVSRRAASSRRVPSRSHDRACRVGLSPCGASHDDGAGEAGGGAAEAGSRGGRRSARDKRGSCRRRGHAPTGGSERDVVTACPWAAGNGAPYPTRAGAVDGAKVDADGAGRGGDRAMGEPAERIRRATADGRIRPASPGPALSRRSRRRRARRGDRLRIRASSGSPMPDTTRVPMERLFGADFVDVRVHAGDEADNLNRMLGARAFTVGSDIFLSGSAPPAETPDGTHLLAHELTHVLQQRERHAARTVRRAVGFEFEDGSWSAFQLQPGSWLRNPWTWGWAYSGKVAPPGTEKSDEERVVDQFTGKNIWAQAGGSHINAAARRVQPADGAEEGHAAPWHRIRHRARRALHDRRLHQPDGSRDRHRAVSRDRSRARCAQRRGRST